MAKSKEEKLADTIASALADKTFNKADFSRHITNKGRSTTIDFFHLIITYFKYLSISEKYNHYPNGEQIEAGLAAEALEILEEYPNALDRYLSSMVR